MGRVGTRLKAMESNKQGGLRSRVGDLEKAVSDLTKHQTVLYDTIEKLVHGIDELIGDKLQVTIDGLTEARRLLQ